MRDWLTPTMTGRLVTCVLLAGVSGCAILPGANMPFPDEVPDQPVANEAPAATDASTAPPPRLTSQTAAPQVSASPSVEPQPPALPPLEPLVVTQLDEAAPVPVLDEQLLSLLLSEPLPVTDLLRLLLRETEVSLVPDPGIDETFTGELKDVTLRQALDLVLRPLDLAYRLEDSVLRVVRRPLQTRVFEVNFLATRRVATRRVSSGSAEGAASPTELVSVDDRDLFTELEKAVRPLLSADGRAHLDRGAALLQVTDLPERVDAVGLYLDRVVRRAGRQVRIEARIIEVALADAASAGLDWQALSRLVPALQGTGGTSIRPILTTRTDVDRFLEALEQQGLVTTLSRPSVVTMNNEPVIVRVDSRHLGVDAAIPPVVGQATEAVVLAMTPQVGLDGLVTLSVTPSITTATGLARSEDDAPVPTSTVRETDTLLRVRDGETAVLTGWLHRMEPAAQVVPDTESAGESSVELAPARAPRLSDLVILLTPTVIDGA
jgi:MSHA biogenesis protein MshL